VDPSTSPPPVLHDELGRAFRVVRRLGRGVAGEVLLARVDAGGLSRLVAVKLLREAVGGDDKAIRRLRDEARMLASLDHPVILTAHELATLDGRLAMVTEYVEGSDFAELIAGRDPVPRGPVLEVVEQVADALHLAWSQHQIVHRDVTPGNIRVGVHGNVKLIDFGIARAELLDRSSHTTQGTLLGTLAYLAPERYDLDVPTQPASDVFSLGCVLYEGWTRSPFFDDLEGPRLITVTDTRESYERWLDERLARPSLGPVAELLRGMLAYDPLDRPGALAVADRCDWIASGMPMRQTLRRWARDRRAESRPTERVTAVDAAKIEAEMAAAQRRRPEPGSWRISEMVTETDLEEPTARTEPRGLRGELGPETPPTLPKPIVQPAPGPEPFRVAPPGPIDPRPAAPEPAPLAPPPGREVSQATTRWLAPVVLDDEDDEPPHRSGGSGVLVASILSVIGGGLLLAAAWVTGTLDSVLP